MNKPERDEMIEEYGRGFETFKAALAEIPRQAWEFNPEAGEWSVHQLILHMADAETIGATRARKLIAEPGATLMVYDDNAWAKALRYQEQDVDDALQLLNLVRKTTYAILKQMPEQVFAQTLVHPEHSYPEYGEAYTLEKWLRIYTRHVRDHVAQLRQIHQAWQLRNK